jgi:hypothetical protein
MISSPLMDGEYDRLVPDYESYRSRKIAGGGAEASAKRGRDNESA